MSLLNESPIFSIIIPAYNVEKSVKHTIDSILKQEFSSCEIIIVDDCSSDNTLLVLKEYEQDKRIVVIKSLINRGVSKARNRGIEVAKGEYLLFLDADDIQTNNCLCKLYEFLSYNDLDLVSFGFSINKNKITRNFFNCDFNKTIMDNNSFMKLYFQRKILQCMCSFIIKRSIVKDNNIQFDESVYYAEDQEFQIYCMYYSKKVGYLCDVLFNYLVNEDSVTQKKINSKHLTIIDVFNKLNVFFIDKEIYSYFRIYALNNYFSLYRSAIKDNELLLVKDKKVDFLTKNINIMIGNELSYKIFIIVMLYKLFPRLLNIVFKIK